MLVLNHIFLQVKQVEKQSQKKNDRKNDNIDALV